MPADITQSWGSWTSTSINASTVTDGSTATTAAINLDDTASVEISVAVTYGSTATEGVKVYVLRDCDGTNYEAVEDKPWGFELAYTASATRRRTFTLCADRVSSAKVHVANDSGASVTATVKTRSSLVEVA